MDNLRGRALDMMMAGRLETDLEDELKKDIDQPEFMEKPRDTWTEEEQKLAKEYEKAKVQVRTHILKNTSFREYPVGPLNQRYFTIKTFNAGLNSAKKPKLMRIRAGKIRVNKIDHLIDRNIMIRLRTVFLRENLNQS